MGVVLLRALIGPTTGGGGAQLVARVKSSTGTTRPRHTLLLEPEHTVKQETLGTAQSLVDTLTCPPPRLPDEV